MENKIKKSILVGSVVFAVSGLIYNFYPSSEIAPIEELSLEEIQVKYDAMRVELVGKYLNTKELSWNELMSFVGVLNQELTGDTLLLPIKEDAILEMARKAL